MYVLSCLAIILSIVLDMKERKHISTKPHNPTGRLRTTDHKFDELKFNEITRNQVSSPENSESASFHETRKPDRMHKNHLLNASRDTQVSNV